jgi:hypothetical protein
MADLIGSHCCLFSTVDVLPGACAKQGERGVHAVVGDESPRAARASVGNIAKFMRFSVVRWAWVGVRAREFLSLGLYIRFGLLRDV